MNADHFRIHSKTQRTIAINQEWDCTIIDYDSLRTSVQVTFCRRNQNLV